MNQGCNFQNSKIGFFVRVATRIILEIPVLVTGFFTILQIYNHYRTTMKRKNHPSLFAFLAPVLFILVIAAGCKKDDNKPETVIDVEGNAYEIVTIGTQVWMAENLRTSSYNDGTAIPLVTDATAWTNLDSPAYCWNNNDEINLGVTYGAFYNFYAVDNASNGGKNICPDGWHAATDAEWSTLVDYLGGNDLAGGKMKTTGTTYWNALNEGATNSSGFSALPGGDRWIDGQFYNRGINAHFWTATAVNLTDAWYRGLVCDDKNTYRYQDPKTNGFSIRCIRD